MEKTLFAQTAEIRGKAAEKSFTVTFQLVPIEERLKQTRGTLFFLAQIEADAEDKALSLGREWFENFKEVFYQSSGSNLKALEGALENLKDGLKQKEIKGEIIAATLWGSVLYVAKAGNVGLFLARGGGAKEIDFAKVASGALADKDTVFLASEGFVGAVDLETLGKASEKADFEEVVAALQDEYREKEAAAFAIRLTVQEPIEKPQEILIADLDKKEETGGELPEEARRKIPLRLPVWHLNFYFLRRLKFWLEGLTAKIAPVAKEYLRNAAFVILSPWLPRPPGVLEDDASRKQKRIIQIVALLAAILLLSIAVGSISRSRSSTAEKRERVISSVESKMAEAEKLKTADPARAANLIDSAEKELSSLSARDSKVASLRSDLANLSAEINRIFPANAETFVDLSSQKGGIQAKALKLASGFLFVSDKGTGSVYRVNLKNKEVSILVSEKKDLQNIAAGKDFLYIQSKDGIKWVDIQTKTEKNQASSSQKWQKLTGADTYKDNLYLLDASAKQIWKYVPTATALAGPQNYLTEALSETPVGFAVDGSVWLAGKSDLLRFFGGKKQNIEVKNLPRSFNEIADIYTREGLTNLYVLDKGEGGVFIIEKASGNYGALYTDNKLKEANSISVDEANKTAYVLAGNTVYSFNLK